MRQLQALQLSHAMHAITIIKVLAVSPGTDCRLSVGADAAEWRRRRVSAEVGWTSPLSSSPRRRCIDPGRRPARWLGGLTRRAPCLDRAVPRYEPALLPRHGPGNR